VDGTGHLHVAAHASATAIYTLQDAASTGPGALACIKLQSTFKCLAQRLRHFLHFTKQVNVVYLSFLSEVY